MDTDWLKGLAPTVAAALGGPLAGVAVKALGAALGWNDATKDDVTKMLSTGQLNADQIAAVQVAELELKKHESDTGFKFAELVVRDRESARNAAVAGKTAVPLFVMSCILISICLGAEVVVLFKGYPSDVPELVVGRILGLLDAVALLALNFHYGSSQSSQVKDATIATQAAK